MNKPTQGQIAAALEFQRPPRSGEVERAVSREAQAARDLLDQIGRDDDDLSSDMVEAETGLTEAIARALSEMDEAQAHAEGVKLLIERQTARMDALRRRADRIRAAIEQAMTVAGLSTLRLPAATLTVKAVPPKPIIEDEALIPAEFWKPSAPKLDRAALNAAAKDSTIPGVTMSNGGASLQIRRA